MSQIYARMAVRATRQPCPDAGAAGIDPEPMAYSRMMSSPALRRVIRRQFAQAEEATKGQPRDEGSERPQGVPRHGLLGDYPACRRCPP